MCWTLCGDRVFLLGVCNRLQARRKKTRQRVRCQGDIDGWSILAVSTVVCVCPDLTSTPQTYFTRVQSNTQETIEQCHRVHNLRTQMQEK